MPAEVTGRGAYDAPICAAEPLPSPAVAIFGRSTSREQLAPIGGMPGPLAIEKPSGRNASIGGGGGGQLVESAGVAVPAAPIVAAPPDVNAVDEAIVVAVAATAEERSVVTISAGAVDGRDEGGAASGIGTAIGGGGCGVNRDPSARPACAITACAIAVDVGRVGGMSRSSEELTVVAALSRAARRRRSASASVLSHDASDSPCMLPGGATDRASACAKRVGGTWRVASPSTSLHGGHPPRLVACYRQIISH